MHLKRYVRTDLGTAQRVYVHFVCNLMEVCVPWQWLGSCLLFYFLFLLFIISCCSAVTFNGFLFFLKKAWKINSKCFHLVLFWKVWPEVVRGCFFSPEPRSHLSVSYTHRAKLYRICEHGADRWVTVGSLSSDRGVFRWNERLCARASSWVLSELQLRTLWQLAAA